MEGLGVVIVLVFIAALVAYSFRVLREYERGVVFQLGRFWKVKGPGLVIVIPGMQQMVRVGLRTVTTYNDTLLSHMYRLLNPLFPLVRRRNDFIAAIVSGLTNYPRIDCSDPLRHTSR